jgi:SSS family solute:Na+ symporter
MIIGARFPSIFIAPFDHGIEMNSARPYSYIRALYNTIVCIGVGVYVTAMGNNYNRFVDIFKSRQSGRSEMIGLTAVVGLAFALALVGNSTMNTQVFSAVFVVILVPGIVGYFVSYDEQKATEGLTSWSLDKAKIMFKGSDINDQVGEKVEVVFKKEDERENIIRFSKNDMERMSANVGDLVYLTDKRKWLGGLKSIHSTYGEIHNEDGVVYMGTRNIETGLFDKGRILIAEKEM